MQETPRPLPGKPDDAPSEASSRRTVVPIIGLLLLVGLHAATLCWSAGRNSVTVDEYAHLPAGLAYLKYREWTIYNQSPPLLRAWAAWPALVAGADVPPATRYRDDRPADRHWNYADQFADLNAHRYHRLLFLSRLPMIALSCAGVVLVYFVSASFFSGRGLLPAALYALCPNVAAHGSIVGTDAGTAVFCLAAIWTWIGFCRRPAPARCLLATLALSAALLCKFSALLLIPIHAAIATWAILLDRGRWRGIALALPPVAFGALLLINLAYGYHGSFKPLGEYEFGSNLMNRVQAILPARAPVPLPREFVRGFDEQKREADIGYPAFLLGAVYRGAHPAYYPVALLTKLPAGTLAILLLTGATLLLPRRRPHADDGEIPLLLSIALFAVGFILLAPINIGVRYLLPIFPIAFVLCGRIVRSGGPRLGRVAPWLLVGVVGVENLSVAPRYLTFFNALAGGPIGGQAILNDSNVDWGQGLIDLRRWMDRHGVERVQLAYFGRVNPRVYGIDYTPATQPGGERLIAVSSYYRAGLSYRLPTPDGGRTGFTNVPIAPALREIEPVALVGNVIWVYDRLHVLEAMKSRPPVR